MNIVQQTFILFLLAYCSTTFYFILVLINNHNFKLHQRSYNGRDSDRKQITCLILEFENFQNDLFATVKNICQSIPRVIIYSETFIYPSINFSGIDDCQIILIELGKSIYDDHNQKDLYNYIKSEYLLILPDSSRVYHEVSITSLEVLFSQIKLVNADGLLIPRQNSFFNDTYQLKCDYFHFDVKGWTLKYLEKNLSSKLGNCLYKNKNGFVLFLTKKSFFSLSFPLLRPFFQSFLIQSQIFKLRIEIFDGLLFSSQSLFLNDYQKAKHDYLEKQRMKVMYAKLGIKKVTYPNDSVEWYGCDRNQPRCFGSIIDNTPDFLIKNRWLPPCCRHNLEITGRYVFVLLEKFQVRYWLEGGSLLGAARNGQIIDWDYDIDIGIYQEDMDKLPILKTLLNKVRGYRMEDGQGFVWEKALEGEFIKVHFSEINRIHVDIFPFVSINGTMTKNTWFENHPQDMPFPEHFLKPLKRILFIGFNSSAPNNIRAFLEMKFGINAIEQSKYLTDKIELDFN